jgi:hypothetical protein
MRFFVPDWLHGGDLSSHRAERFWGRLCSDVSKRHGEPLAQRVYRLRYVWDGEEMEALVGEPDQFGAGLAVAIVAVPTGYVLNTRQPGDRFGGSLIPIDIDDVRDVELFDT